MVRIYYHYYFYIFLSHQIGDQVHQLIKISLDIVGLKYRKHFRWTRLYSWKKNKAYSDGGGQEAATGSL